MAAEATSVKTSAETMTVKTAEASVTAMASIVESNTSSPFAGLPEVTLQLTNLDDSGDMIYIGIDFAVFEEVEAAPGDPEDTDGDGKVFKAKEGKVKRFLTNSTNITIDLGQPSEYKKVVRHKLAMRTLYTPTGTSSGEIIIAEQSNGKDGWVEIPGSLFQLSYFAPIDSDNPIIKHTEKWEENRDLYNSSKIAAGLVTAGTEARPYSTFWSGEKLLIEVKANEAVDAIRISLLETTSAGVTTPYTTTITSYTPDPDVTGGAIYKDEMWDKSMINKWGNYTPKILTVELQAIVSGSAVETQCSNIVMDNKDQFYRIKKVF